MTAQLQPRSRFRKLNWERCGREFICRESGDYNARTFYIAPEPGQEWRRNPTYLLWVSGQVEARGSLREMFERADQPTGEVTMQPTTRELNAKGGD